MISLENMMSDEDVGHNIAYLRELGPVKRDSTLTDNKKRDPYKYADDNGVHRLWVWRRCDLRC